MGSVEPPLADLIVVHVVGSIVDAAGHKSVWVQAALAQWQGRQENAQDVIQLVGVLATCGTLAQDSKVAVRVSCVLQVQSAPSLEACTNHAAF